MAFYPPEKLLEDYNSSKEAAAKKESLFDYSGPQFTDDELRFRNITEKMRATFLKKNHDYGNSFHETWEEFGDKGIITALTQISHKYHRLMNIGLGTKPLVDESIDDTLLDMANYCILTIMELEKARNNDKSNGMKSSR